MANEVRIEIYGDDHSDRAFDSADRRQEQFFRDSNNRLRNARGQFVREGQAMGEGLGRGTSDGANRHLSRLWETLGRVATRVREAAMAFAQGALKVGVFASTIASLGPVLAPVAGALIDVGTAAVNAAPALLALMVAFQLTKFALTQIFKEGSAARKALEPLTDRFNKASEAASKAAASGIKPLVEQFNKLNMPTVHRSMVNIGEAVNKVEKGFFRWANSAAGVKSIKGILDPIGHSAERLAPHITKVGISFASMLGRIMGVSTAAGTSGLAKVLDNVAEYMDKINKKTVGGGLTKLADTFHTIVNAIRTVVGWFQKLHEAYSLYTKQFGLLADAISILGIAFGGPVTAIVAGAGLIIRHFDQIKEAYAQFQEVLKSPQGQDFMADLTATAQEKTGQLKEAFSGLGQNLQSFGKDVLPEVGEAFGQIWESVGPELEKVFDQITNELIPAFGDFVEAMGPVVAFIVDQLGPIVAESFANIVRVIQGAIDIITGIFEVLSGVLTGDWSKVWDGIKHIAQGAGKILGAAIRQVVFLIKTAWHPIVSLLMTAARAGVNNAVSVMRGLGRGISAAIRGAIGLARSAASAVKNAIVSVFKGAGSWLVGAGRAVVQGLLNGIESLAGAVMDKLSSLASKIRGFFPFSPAKHGPLSGRGDMKNAGKAIIKGLVDGLEGSTGEINSAMGKVASAVRKIFSGRHEDRLLKWVARNTQRLRGLAAQRDAIAKKIAEAQKYAADVAGNARGFASLTSLGETRGAGDIRAGLLAKLDTIRAFGGAIAQLSKMGLNKDLLRQIIDAGPEAGLKLAQQLLGASKGDFAAINKAQQQIGRAAGSLGAVAADALYDAGKGAANGFLEGLKRQQRALQHQMDILAERFAKGIRKAFHVPGHRDNGWRAVTRHAAGGVTSGIAQLNEQGYELVRLPNGSMVYPAGQSDRMLGGGRQGAVEVRVRWVGPGGGPGDSFMTWLRKNIRIEGGNVQDVLGS